MGLEFRRRDYRAEERTHSLPRTRADTHPLSAPFHSPPKVEESDSGKDDFVDPLRATDVTMNVSTSDMGHEVFNLEANSPIETSAQLKAKKEWNFIKKMLTQRFPASKTTQTSLVSGSLFRGNKVEKSSKDLHSGESSDHTKFNEEDVKVSQQEFLSKLQELKEEIKQSWCAGDRVTSLRLSIKVARLLMDTSVIHFYPTLFVLATDILDMLGDLVWNRVKQKAEITEEGEFVCSLPDKFKATDISFDAKETCNNWFNKIGSIYELLPRIYLELAILHCWRFLHDHPENILQRLVVMTRGIADPLASTYCRLFLVQCAQRLPEHDTGYLITCINDLKVPLMCLTTERETVDKNLSGKKKLILTLIEPAIEYITRCLFKEQKQMDINDMLVALGMWRRNPSILSEGCYCISLILHYVLKELPIEFICFNAMEILNVIECADNSTFDQHLNLKLLGHRLCEKIPEVSSVHLVLDKIIQVLSCYDNLDAYLMVADACLDIILENQLGNFLNMILDGIYERIREDNIGENELVILESIFLKYLTHFTYIENILALHHFVEILDMMHGTSRNSVNIQILNMATRNGQIRDPMVIEVLFELAQALNEGSDFSNMRKDDYQHPARIISRFVYMVDYGTDVESQLRFLGQCRGAFASISELQEVLVHSSNNLAVRTMREGNSSISFLKSCLAFNEVTIPAITTSKRQLNLYLETVEVALLGGFISHLDGLIDAAVNCWQNIDGGLVADDLDLIISLICKLCGLLVIIPGHPQQGLACIPMHILSFLDSHSWILPRMKIKVLSAVAFSLAALSQDQLLYHTVSGKILGNHQLFFGDQFHHQELLSLAHTVLLDIVNVTMQESSKALCGKMALEACNCIVSSFTLSHETLEACSKLVEIAKSCLSRDDKFLQSTLIFIDARLGLKLGK